MRERKENSSRSEGSERLVIDVFARIAEVLLRVGVDAPKAEQMLRKAFVLAAKASFSNADHRLTQTQLASMTGMSRLEVRNLLKKTFLRVGKFPSRLEQVVTGWKTDSKYLDRRGRPKPLPLKGEGGTFESLAKRFGRDVTPRALRIELVRYGLAAIRDEKIYLEASPESSSPRLLRAQSDLRFLHSYLAGCDFRNCKRSYVIRRRVISSSSAKESNVIKQIAIDRLQAALRSIAELTEEKSTNHRVEKNVGRRLVVTTVVAAEGEN